MIKIQNHYKRHISFLFGVYPLTITQLIPHPSRLMHIQLDQQCKKFCFIQSIKPGRLNIWKISIGILLTLVTIGIPIILYWKWQRFKNLIHLIVFDEQDKDSPQISHYLIVDSFKYKGKSRNICYRTQIVLPYLVQKESSNRGLHLQQSSSQPEICKYIQHKNLRYVIRNNTLLSFKFKFRKDIEDYINNGLSPDQIDQSNKLYGKPYSFKISFVHILKKILHQKNLRFVFMMFAVKKIVFGFVNPDKSANQSNETIVSITILAQMIFIWLMMLGMSIAGSIEHNQIHQKLQKETFYKVIRKKGQQIEQINIKLNDLCVGDVIIPTLGDVLYIKGILVSNLGLNGYSSYAIINEKLYNSKDIPITKIAISDNLVQIEQSSIIYPGSLIMSSGVSKDTELYRSNQNKQKQQSRILRQNSKPKRTSSQLNKQSVQIDAKIFIIVTDNNYLQNFYQCYRQADYYNNFQSLRGSYDHQQLIFQAFFLVVALISTYIVAVDKKTHEHWLNLLLSNIILCFPFNLGLFCNFSQILSIIRLKRKNISVVNPSIEEIAIANCLSIQLSTFQTLQFRGFVKKQRCIGLPQPEGYNGKINFFQTYRRTKQQSIYALLGWAGVYNLPFFQKQSLFKTIFERFDFSLKEKDDYTDDSTQNPRVVNRQETAVKIDWQEVQRFSISDRLIETVVIKNFRSERQDKRFFAITQGFYTSLECFKYFDQLLNEPGTQQFKDVMQRLHAQGKKIRYLCIKKMLQNQNMQKEIITKWSREYVQTESEFGGILVFDQWPTKQNMKSLIELDTSSVQNSQTGLHMQIFSVRQQNALIGYDHILRKTSIFHSAGHVTRTMQVAMSKTDSKGVAYVGHGILDQGSFLAADISIKKISEGYGQADFQLQDPKEILTLFYEGEWALYNTTLTVVCLVLFNFSKIVGQLVLFEGESIDTLQPSPLSANYDKLFVIDFGALLIPLLLLNMYEPRHKLARKNQTSFFRVQLMYHTFVSIVGLVVLYTIEFIDHGFQGTCQIYQNSLNNRYLLQLRQNSHEFIQNQGAQQCEGIVDFITISFAFLVILLIDRQSPSRKARSVIVGLLNKIYMLSLWVGSIIYFRIPQKNILRGAVVILIMPLIVYLSEFLIGKKYQKEQDSLQISQSMSANQTPQEEPTRIFQTFST